MGVGDIVKALHVANDLDKGRRNVGFIVKVDQSELTKKHRYWVKLFGGWSVGPVPFLAKQLEVLSESR